ncbi:MAG: hypothetical protein LBB24_03300 [Rickettsiales bacterium]|nr:hypothetical protein [Rickettsiales bacterium]
MKRFEEIKTLYDRVFKDIDGYRVSYIEKQHKIGDRYIKDLIYGEIPLELLYALFALEPTRSYMARGKVFYDLGSGIGNAVIGSYLIGDFEKCVGIELLDGLHRESRRAKENLCAIDGNARDSVHFIQGNILDFDLTDGDVLLFCCPNRDEGIRLEMEKKFLTLKNGAIIFSLIHVFKNTENFHPLDSRMVRMAWGQTPLTVYERVIE